MDFAAQTGTSVSAADGIGYVIIEPLPAELYTDTQTGLPVTWTSYDVTVTINGSAIPVSFGAGATMGIPINNVPVGAALSAAASIGVAASGGGTLGYSTLTAATTGSATIQSGANSITMWVQYPVECHVSSGLPPEAAITGTAPSCYTNIASAALPETTPSYVDSATGKTMRFTGWALTDGGTPAITGSSIPISVYKGKLSLYATWGECTLSITGATTPAAGGDPVLVADETLALTAVPAGFPAGQSISYSWHILPPASGTAPATVSGSGAGATVYPVAGSGGSATVEVTAACGTLTASAQLTLNVQVSLPDFTIQITPPASYKSAKSDATAKKYALVNLTDAFSFTPVPAPGKSFPAGTTFEWTVAAGSGSPVSQPDTALGTACTAALSDLGLTDAVIGRTAAAATGITVTCTAKHTYAAADKDASAPSTASAFLLQTIPAFTIELTLPDSYNSANSTAASNKYALTSLTDSITLTATPPSSPATPFPADTTFVWKIGGTVVNGVTGASCTLTPAALGMTSTSPGTASSPKSKVISCTAKNDSAAADVAAPAKTVKAFLLSIPDFKITVTPPDDVTAATISSNTVYLVTDTSMMSENFTFEAVPKTSGASFPVGTTFTWSFDTSSTPQNVETMDARTSVLTGSTSLPESQQDITVTCTAACGTVEKDSDESTVRIAALTVDTLAAYLRTLPSGTVAGPNVMPPITGLTVDNWTQLKSILHNSYKYIDLSATMLPDGITDMYKGFFDCRYLVKAPGIPEGVTNMNSCFSQCTNLTSAPAIPSSVTNLGLCFYLSTNLVNISDFVVPDGVTDMHACFAGTGLTDLSGLTIPDSVTTMESCFLGCSNLTSTAGLTIGSGVTSMENCFEGCSSLTSVSGLTIPNSVTTMWRCFLCCPSLTDVSGLTIGSSVTSMNSCFYGCTSLTKAPVIPGNVNTMQGCFANCTELGGTITINTTLCTTSDKWKNCFQNCDADKINAIVVPDTPTSTALRNATGTSDALKAKIVP